MAAEKQTLSLKWEAQTFRLTVFLASPYEKGDTLWKDLTGEQPESDERRPREGVHKQAGTWRDRTLETIASLPRIDVLLSPPLTLGAERIPVLGAFTKVAKSFRDLTRPWLAKTDLSCQRLAVGSVLVSRAPNRVTAYNLMSKLVPSVRVDPQKSKELFYRINRPVRSKTEPSLELNRMTTWTTIKLRIATGLVGGKPIQSKENHYVRLECDHNTPGDREQPLDASTLPAILDELILLTEQNAKRGELA